MDKELRVIVSGGGTGGHIFPAVSIANAIRQLCPTAKILFVGALGRMEMQRVPAAGYEIKGLPIRGFYRPLWKPANIGVAFDYIILFYFIWIHIKFIHRLLIIIISILFMAKFLFLIQIH